MGHWPNAHFIDELSRHRIQMHIFNPLLYKSWDEANDRAIKEIKEGEFDLFFTSECESPVLSMNIFSEIKKMGIPSMCLRFDNLVIPLYDKEMAPLFDLVWLTSIETKRFYDKWGAKTCFAPYAANPYTFKFIEKPCINRACFVGTPYGSRARLFNTLLQNNVDLTLYFGHSCDDTTNEWEHYDTYIAVPLKSKKEEIFNRLKFKEGRIMLKGALKNKLMGKCQVEQSEHLEIKPAVAPIELSNIYSEYALSIASTSVHHTDVLKNPLKIINLRNFEIPMSGGVELCKYNPELANYYEEDKEILFYRSNEELVEKAIYYSTKASESELKAIRIAARSRSEKDHTWMNRFAIMFKELGLKY